MENKEKELLSQIYNLILNPMISNDERAYLVRIKDQLEKGGNEQYLLERLQGYFQVKADKHQLSTTFQSFYDTLPIDAKTNPASRENTRLFSAGRKIALMAAIMYMIATANQTIAALMLASLGSSGMWGPDGTLINGSPVVLPGGTNGVLVLTIIFAQFIFVWLAFGFFDRGTFWTILLFIFGAYCAIWSLYQMFSNSAISGFFLLIAASMMITAVIVKLSDRGRQK